MEEKNIITRKIKVDTAELDAATGKIEHLVALLKEADSLVNELASKDLELYIKF